MIAKYPIYQDYLVVDQFPNEMQSVVDMPHLSVEGLSFGKLQCCFVVCVCDWYQEDSYFLQVLADPPCIFCSL